MDNLLNTAKKLQIDKSHWQTTKMGDLASEISNRVDNPAQSEYQRFVGLEHFVSGDLKINSWGSTENLVSSAKAFQKGDILFARRNAYLRRASMVDFDGCCSGDAFVLREHHIKVAHGFLAFLMNSSSLWDFANSNAAGTMSKRVKWHDLSGYEFLLPPKEQQVQLSELLWSIDEVIVNGSRTLSLNKLLYQSKREELFFYPKGRLNLIFQSKLKINTGKDLTFISLGSVLIDIKYGTSQKGNSFDRGYKVIGIPNVINEALSLDKLSFTELSEKEYQGCKLAIGDIVIVRTNGNPDYTGRSAIYNIDEGHAFASYLIKISINKEKYNPEFLVRYLQTSAVRKYFRRHATSTAGNYNINTETIKALPLPIVSLEVQDNIVEKLKCIESATQMLKTNLENAKAIQKSLINQIF